MMFKEVNFSNILFYLIVILLTSNCLFLSALSVQFTKFMKSTNVKNIEFFSSQEGLSMYQCLENCKKDATCDSLSYSDDGMKCYLSVGRQCGSSGQGLEAVDGWNVFDKTCSYSRYLLPDVPDDHLTASSFDPDNDHRPTRARLYTVREQYDGVVHVSAWVSQVINQDQYIQADFSMTMMVTGIVTQSRGALFDHWVSSYKFLYSLDCVEFTYYNSDMIFPGNTYRSEDLVINYLPCPVRARCVRVNPWTWNEIIALRFDVLGCSA